MGCLSVYTYSGILNVTLGSKLEGKFLICIYNSIGQQVLSLETVEKAFKIDLATTNMSSGLNLLEASNNEGNQLMKAKFIYERK